MSIQIPAQQGRIARAVHLPKGDRDPMKSPLPAPFDFEIGGRKIEDSPVAFEGPMVAKVIMPGTSEPEVVQTIGDIGEATVVHPRDPSPHPAGSGSWPPDEADIQAQALANAMREPQFWTAKQATPTGKPKNDPEIL